MLTLNSFTEFHILSLGDTENGSSAKNKQNRKGNCYCPCNFPNPSLQTLQADKNHDRILDFFQVSKQTLGLLIVNLELGVLNCLFKSHIDNHGHDIGVYYQICRNVKEYP